MPARDRKTGRINKKAVFFIIVCLLISSILYLLAERYLIDHVEKIVSDEELASDHNIDESGQGAKNNVKYDDWNYESGGISIHIKEETTGSGSQKITYFVADVILQDASDLRSAFAENKFGRNIVEDTSKIAKDNQGIFAINGDYYGFRGDGVLIRNGQLYRDVPARTALAIYKNGTMKSFDETEISSASLLADGVINTLSFGPVLVQDEEVEEFQKVVVDTNFGNRSIQQSNPRTGIGMIEPNHFVFIVVDGRKEGYSRGMTLTEFAQTFEDLGCTEAYNLDGGGSSTMYFMGRVVNNPLGKQDERSISDILYIRE